ncbi:hypothetical protein NLJ89_g6056 [Agrocybe chaxingu]|uniref:NACHT domain-containing protein n=1 Tax=Agrocybe chaxingu TaxID=84603 RepID=A0A9W8MUF7_9AGAR|nr:hypothetical protein NLJ89_g6056 [Agrocybe chaxingu]
MAESHIFANANNVFIQDSHIHAVQNHYQADYQVERRTLLKGMPDHINPPDLHPQLWLELDLLCEKSAFNALVDSNARYDAPKCDEGTREAIIQRIMDWIESDEAHASALWLHGPAGSGKSALAKTIAELCMAKKSLIATFFFTRTRIDRVTDGNLLIPTLAYQLAGKMALPRRHIKKLLLRDPAIFYRTRQAQMEELIIKPLNTYFSRLEHNYKRLFQGSSLRLIVIDGLDECFGKDVQRDLLGVLGKTIERLRLPIRFLIASRPETQIRTLIIDDGVFKADHLVTLDLGNDPNTAHDIRTYLEIHFTKTRYQHPIRTEIPTSWPSIEDITTLVERASGQFIYVSTVYGYVSSSKHNPVKRLAIIIERLPPPRADSPYGQLDLLYQLIFSSAEESGLDIDKVLQAFGILIIERPKGALDYLYRTYAGVASVLGVTPGEVALLLDEFVSLIALPPLETPRPIQILHASLADFLLDSSRCGRFYIDKRRIHSILASSYSERMGDLVSTMTRATHRDDLEHHFLPFITHCQNSYLPAGDFSNAMSLIAEALFFACHCAEPCDAVAHASLANDPTTSSLAAEWNEQIKKKRFAIITITPYLDSWKLPAWSHFSEKFTRTRWIVEGPEMSHIEALQSYDVSKVFREDELIVIDIPSLSPGQCSAVLEWVKRCCTFLSTDVMRDMDWAKSQECHGFINYFQGLCPVGLFLTAQPKKGELPTRSVKVKSNGFGPIFVGWQQATQSRGRLLWCEHWQESEASLHQILLDTIIPGGNVRENGIEDLESAWTELVPCDDQRSHFLDVRPLPRC